MGDRGVSLGPVGGVLTRVGVGGGRGGGLLETLSSSTIIGSSSSSGCTSGRTHASMATPIFSYNYENEYSDNPGIPNCDSGSAEYDECEWVAVYGIEYEGDCGYGFHGHCILGHVPSEDEVEDAVFALQSVLGPDSPIQHVRQKYMSHEFMDNDGVEPSLSPYTSRIIQSQGPKGIYYALHLLQTEPSVQKMVKPFSSDKAIWDAILNNEAVQELSESLFEDEELKSKSLDGISEFEPHTTTNIVMQIFHAVKVKFMDIIEKITVIKNELFQPTKQKIDSEAKLCDLDCIHEIVRNSLMLSIMVLLVVMVGRRAKNQGGESSQIKQCLT